VAITSQNARVVVIDADTCQVLADLLGAARVDVINTIDVLSERVVGTTPRLTVDSVQGVVPDLLRPEPPLMPSERQDVEVRLSVGRDLVSLPMELDGCPRNGPRLTIWVVDPALTGCPGCSVLRTGDDCPVHPAEPGVVQR
jgi:hypothetical protein